MPNTLELNAHELNTIDAPNASGGFRFPKVLVAGRCSVCPSAPLGWVYRDPLTRARFCMDCLVAAANDPGADPALAAIGREILHARSLDTSCLDTSRLAPPALPTVRPLDIAGRRFCTDCGAFGVTWQNPDTCDMFCLACTKHFIEWQEGELRQGYAALARLTEMPQAEARPYHRRVHCKFRYQAAA